MELVPSRRSPPKSSMLSGLAATMKGKAASMQEDAKGKVSYAAMSCVSAPLCKVVQGTRHRLYYCTVHIDTVDSVNCWRHHDEPACLLGMVRMKIRASAQTTIDCSFLFEHVQLLFVHEVYNCKIF